MFESSFPGLPETLAKAASAARAELRGHCKAHLEDEEKARSKESTESFVASARRYADLCKRVHGAFSERPLEVAVWDAGSPAIARTFQWRVAVFGGGADDVPEKTRGEVSILYNDPSFLFERTCALLALAAALQRHAQTLAKDGQGEGQEPPQCAPLREAAGALTRLRGQVLPLFRATHGEGRVSHVFSSDFVGALQCAVTGQLFVCKARPLLRTQHAASAWLLFRAAQLFEKACAAMPCVGALRVSRLRASAFAYAAVGEAVLQDAGEAGVSEACMDRAERAVRGEDDCASLHAVFAKRLDKAHQQNKFVFGCMRVPEEGELVVRCEEQRNDGGQGSVAVTRDERGVVTVALRGGGK